VAGARHVSVFTGKLEDVGASQPTRPRRLRGLLAGLGVAAIAVLPLAGCGSSSSTTSSSAPAATPPATSATTQATSSAAPATAQQLSDEATPSGELKYTKSTLTAKAGTVTVAFTNSSPLAHNFTVESSAGKTLGGTPTFQGGTHTLTLTGLKAGTYKFFCTVPGHRMAGMEGTLVITT
jgi:plastocyanin